jgi:hypothetical protein
MSGSSNKREREEQEEEQQEVDEELQGLKDDFKKSQAAYMLSQRNLMDAHVNLRLAMSARGDALVLKPKRTRKAKADAPAAPAEEKKKEKKKDETPFVCAGNVFTDEPCPKDSDANDIEAPSKIQGPDKKTLYRTCKPCQKANKKSRAEQKKE